LITALGGNIGTGVPAVPTLTSSLANAIFTPAAVALATQPKP
jgi:hypothetical protein